MRSGTHIGSACAAVTVWTTTRPPFAAASRSTSCLTRAISSCGGRQAQARSAADSAQTPHMRTRAAARMDLGLLSRSDAIKFLQRAEEHRRLAQDVGLAR